MIPTFFMYYRGFYDLVFSDTKSTFEACFSFLLQLIADLFMIRGGIFSPIGNSPTWYLSVLLISGGLLYALLKHYQRQAISIVIPVACLMAYGYFHATHLEQWGTINGLSMPYIRGFADMGLGVLIYEVFIQKQIILSSHQKWIDTASILSLMFVVMLILIKANRDLFVIIFMPVFIMGLLCKQSCWNQWLTSKIWIFLGGLSYEMLLIHMFVRGPFVKFEVYQWMNPWLLGISYMALVLLCSYLLKYTSMKIQKRLGW